jgi:hypothetical protein
MDLKLVVVATLLAAAPIVAFAQKDDPSDHPSTPTVEEAQSSLKRSPAIRPSCKPIARSASSRTRWRRLKRKTTRRRSMLSSQNLTASNAFASDRPLHVCAQTGDGQTTDQGSQDEQCESQRSRIGLFSPRAVSVSIKVVPCRARDTKLREQFLPPYALTESAARHAVQMVVTRRRLNEEQIGRVGEVGLFLVSDRILPSEWQSLPRRDPKPACERLPPIRAPQTRATRWLETAKK